MQVDVDLVVLVTLLRELFMDLDYNVQLLLDLSRERLESASRKLSPGSTLPPGNSHLRPMYLSLLRWAIRYMPSFLIIAATTSWGSIMCYIPKRDRCTAERYLFITGLAAVFFMSTAGAAATAANDDLLGDGIADVELARQMLQALVLIGVEHYHHIGFIVAYRRAILAVLERFLPSCHFLFGVVYSQQGWE